MSLYASTKYSDPDQSAFDVHLASSPNETHTPVLYVRGTDPVYIRVNGQTKGSTCNDVFTIHVKEKSDVFNGKYVEMVYVNDNFHTTTLCFVAYVNISKINDYVKNDWPSLSSNPVCSNPFWVFCDRSCVAYGITLDSWD